MTAFLLLLSLAGGDSLHSSPTAINYINMYVRLAEEQSCGLHKLTRAERSRLNEVFKAVTERLDDNLRNSALAYLRRQGWQELAITGAEQLALDESRGPLTYTIATLAGARFVLEPRHVATLMPGEYLGRVDSSECRIIGPQGNVVEFWVRKAGL